MLDTIYRLGMDKAAQEFGYATFEEFQKEAGVLTQGVGTVAKSLAGKGALVGAGLGAAGNMAFGDSNQGLLERAGKGALGGGLAGAAIGGAGGALGQSRYNKQFTDARNALKSQGTSLAQRRSTLRDQYKDAPNFLSAPIAKARNYFGV